MKNLPVLLIIFLLNCSTGQSTKFQDGDIIFQTSKSNQSKALQIATKSKFGHMGIIYNKDGQQYVYEAVQSVKLTRLKDWINRGVESKYAVKRLKNASEILNPASLNKLKKAGEKFLGKKYVSISNGLMKGYIVQSLSGKCIIMHWVFKLVN